MWPFWTCSLLFGRLIFFSLHPLCMREETTISAMRFITEEEEEEGETVHPHFPHLTKVRLLQKRKIHISICTVQLCGRGSALVCGLSSAGFPTLKHNTLHNPELINTEHQLRIAWSALAVGLMGTCVHKWSKNVQHTNIHTSWNLFSPSGVLWYNRQISQWLDSWQQLMQLPGVVLEDGRVERRWQHVRRRWRANHKALADRRLPALGVEVKRSKNVLRWIMQLPVTTRGSFNSQSSTNARSVTQVKAHTLL